MEGYCRRNRHCNIDHSSAKRQATADETDAWKRLLDSLSAEARTIAAQDAARTPFMRYWHIYADSAAAKRLSDRMFLDRRRAWRAFAEWMRERHPEADGFGRVGRTTGEEYLACLARTRSNGTCNIHLLLIREVFGALVDEFGGLSNPWDSVSRLPDDTVPRRELSYDEISRLIGAACAKGSEWALLFRLAAYTGMRLCECCRLEWKNIIMERDIIQIVPAKTRGIKGFQPVTIPIHAKLKRFLLAVPMRMHWGPVLPEISELYRTRAACVSREIAGIFKQAGIAMSMEVEGRLRKVSHASFHSLRHSFVSFAVNAGTPIEAVKAIVGHETSAMTRHYYHAEEGLMRKAVSAIPSYDTGGNRASIVSAAGSRRVAERLAELYDVFQSGLVSQSEYDAIRCNILSSI
ncbi:MAG: tyrosine-type recombinase/integrase [Kiritimatiellae bacterium]|nr:tyrosine-type recombinase/integrase [Kiritimatiellia bacterium]